MKYRKRKTCHRCDNPLPDGSHAKYCARCRDDVASENALQVRARSGPAYEKWLTGMRRFLEQTRLG